MQTLSADFFDDRDDVDLLSRARNGDARCADVLWIRVRPAVLAAARAITGNRYDAEDLASEAMTKVFAAIAAGQGPSESVLPYLYATMRNLHISALRRQARVGAPIELDEQRVLNLVTDEPDVIESELVTQAFKALPDRWRQVLWASLVEGRHGNEIAADLNIKPAAVHALKSRALEGLRQQYLSEHAKRSEEQECTAVHRVLASIARGRARRSTDLNQVWRHLRGCEHCAEGYREITAINNRIGALLGPSAAATVVGIAPHLGSAVTFGVLKAPAAASKLVAAAGVAGVLAVAGTTATLGTQDDSAAPRTSVVTPAISPAAAAPARAPAPRASKARPAVGSSARPTAPAPGCLPTRVGQVTTGLAALDQLDALPEAVLREVPAAVLSTDRCRPAGSATSKPAPVLPVPDLDPAETLAKVPALVDLPTPLDEKLPVLPVPVDELLEP